MITRCLYYLEDILQILKLNLSLQNLDMNIVRALQTMKAFMNKFVYFENESKMTHNFCNFPSFYGKEIGCELQMVIVYHLSLLLDNFQARFEDLLQLNIPPSVKFLHAMSIEDVMVQPE